MQKKSQITSEIAFLNSLKGLATVYQSISIMKMQQIRNSVTTNRVYVDSLMDIFHSLQYGRAQETTKEELANARASAHKPLATVIITANSKFHGDILRKIFNFFINKYDHSGDLYVVGKIGRELIQAYDGRITFKEYDISDLNFSIHDLKPILFDLLQYKKIQVYYAIFKNIVDQIPVLSDITDLQKLTSAELVSQHGNENIEFIYEPSAKVITSFIHNNVVAMLFLQSVYDTHLARLASRMKAMDTLLNKVNININDMAVRERRIKRAIADNKQLQRMSGMSIW